MGHRLVGHLYSLVMSDLKLVQHIPADWSCWSSMVILWQHHECCLWVRKEEMETVTQVSFLQQEVWFSILLYFSWCQPRWIKDHKQVFTSTSFTFHIPISDPKLFLPRFLEPINHRPLLSIIAILPVCLSDRLIHNHPAPTCHTTTSMISGDARPSSTSLCKHCCVVLNLIIFALRHTTSIALLKSPKVEKEPEPSAIKLLSLWNHLSMLKRRLKTFLFDKATVRAGSGLS